MSVTWRKPRIPTVLRRVAQQLRNVALRSAGPSDRLRIDYVFFELPNSRFKYYPNRRPMGRTGDLPKSSCIAHASLFMQVLHKAISRVWNEKSCDYVRCKANYKHHFILQRRVTFDCLNFMTARVAKHVRTVDRVNSLTCLCMFASLYVASISNASCSILHIYAWEYRVGCGRLGYDFAAPYIEPMKVRSEHVYFWLQFWPKSLLGCMLVHFVVPHYSRCTEN